MKRRLMPSHAELVAFEAVARLGSFTRAANELALTQGALSKQIRQLEVTLGVRLFERTKRDVRLTRQGDSYVNAIQPLLWKLERATHSVIASGREEHVLTCAVLPAFEHRWLAPRLAGFAAGHPDLSVRCTSYSEPFDFDEEPADLAIHLGRPNWPGTDAHHLFDEILVAVASPEYRERHHLRQPADLANAVQIHHARRSAAWLIWMQSLGLDESTAPRAYTFDSTPAVAAAAVAGLGVALVPTFYIEPELRSGALVALFDHSVGNMEAYYLVVPTARTDNPDVIQFTDWILAEARRPAAAHRH
jgi:DNA-binding transcriptional LysR family regulator